MKKSFHTPSNKNIFRKIRRIKQILTIIFLLKIVVVSAQPSYNFEFKFRLFDNNGKIIDFKNFCNNYQLLNDYLLLKEYYVNGKIYDVTPCTNKSVSKKSFYDDRLKMFRYNSSSGDKVLFIHNSDTMLLIFDPYQTRNFTCLIDSLIIKPGKYVINDSILKEIDFKQAELNYYNCSLNWAMGTKKTFGDYIGSPAWIELNRLKKKYGISSDDFKEKKLNEIFK